MPGVRQGRGSKGALFSKAARTTPTDARGDRHSRRRGWLIDLDPEAQFLAAVPPSFLLRLKEEADKRREGALFPGDLAIAGARARDDRGKSMDE